MKAKSQVVAAAVLLCTVTLAGCGTWWLPRPHKIDIQQGNIISTESVEKVTVGMSREQVANLLGRPIAINQVNPNRWDYIYSINRSGERPKVQRVSLLFENEQVATIQKDGLPPAGS